MVGAESVTLGANKPNAVRQVLLTGDPDLDRLVVVMRAISGGVISPPEILDFPPNVIDRTFWECQYIPHIHHIFRKFPQNCFLLFA